MLTADVEGSAQRIRTIHAVLRVADPRQRHPWRHELVVDVQLAQRLLHDRDLVGRIVDHEITTQPDLRRLTPQQSGTQRVERREPHTLRVGPDQTLDALAHLLRRLVRER